MGTCEGRMRQMGSKGDMGGVGGEILGEGGERGMKKLEKFREGSRMETGVVDGEEE